MALLRRFAMAGSVTQVTGSGPYTTKLTLQADQTGGGWTGNVLQVGWRVVTSTGQQYVIANRISSSLFAANLELEALGGTTGAPSGTVMVYSYDGATQTVPTLPENATGISSALVSVINTHNTEVSRTESSSSPEPGSQTISSLASLTALASSTTATRAVIPSSMNLTSSLDLPKGVDLSFVAGGALTFAKNVVLRVGGQVYAPRRTIFSGPGKIVLEGKEAKVEWFGAKADATHDDRYICTNPASATRGYHAFRKAKLAVGEYGTVTFGPGNFYMSDETQLWLDANAGKFQRSNFCLRWHERIAAHVDQGVTIPDTPFYTHGLRVVLDPNTVLLPEGDRTKEYGSVEISPYRTSGWKSDVVDSVTFFDTVTTGTREITARVPGSLAGFEPEQIRFANGGASRFDQHFGQLNRVESVTGDVVRFWHPFEKDLTVERSSAGGKTLDPFIMPAEGQIVTVRASRDGEEPGSHGVDQGGASIGNDYFATESANATIKYQNIAGRGNQIPGTVIPANTAIKVGGTQYGRTLDAFTIPAEGAFAEVRLFRELHKTQNLASKNLEVFVGTNQFKVNDIIAGSESFTFRSIPGKGNQVVPGTTVPAGTPIFRPRAIVNAVSCVKDARLEGGKIAAFRNGPRMANTYQATIIGTEFIHQSLINGEGGLWMDSDGGYGARFVMCTFREIGGTVGNSQWARSTTNALMEGCTFIDSYFDASEFATNIRVRGGRFECDFTNDPNKHPVIITDGTTSRISFDDVEIYATKAREIIRAAGVQSFSNTAGGNARFTNLYIVAERCKSIFNGPEHGRNVFLNISITSRTGIESIWGSTAKPPLNGLYGDSSGRFAIGAGTYARNIHFQGKIDAVTTSAMKAADIETEIVFEGYADFGDLAGLRARGTVLRKNEDGSPTNPHDIKLRYKLWNWPVQDGGLYGSGLTWTNHSSAIIEYRNTNRGSGPTNYYTVFGNVAPVTAST